MKYLVIAQHHGAFLTISQLQEWGRDFAVVIPRTQIEKYSKMDGAIFKNYEKNIRKAAGSAPVIISEAFSSAKFFETVNASLQELGATGQWTVMMAGALLLGYTDEPLKLSHRFNFCKQRVHPRFKRLYKMIGEPEESATIFGDVFVVDADNTKIMNSLTSSLDSSMFMRPDPLYAKSFGPLWCLRHRHLVNEALVASFWMEAIRVNQEEGEPVAYPYHLYGEYAKGVKKYLPPVTYNTILENAAASEYYQDLVKLDL